MVKLLGVFGYREISEWRQILGDQKFSKLIDYLAYRIIQEDIEYGSEVARDTQLLIEFLHDLAGDFISIREFERLCDSLIEAIPKSFDQEINIGDIRNFLDIRRFGQLPDNLYVKGLVLKAEEEFSVDSKYDCMMVEFFNNNLNYNLVEQVRIVEQVIIDDVQGHVLDVIEDCKPDLIMLDNSLTRIVESNKHMLRPLVKFSQDHQRSLAGLVTNPRTTNIKDLMLEQLRKKWSLPVRDTELLKFILIPGSFTRLFQDNFGNIDRNYIYFMPKNDTRIWKINTYYQNINQDYFSKKLYIRDISLLPIADRVTEQLLLKGKLTDPTQAYTDALLKANMIDLVYLIKKFAKMHFLTEEEYQILWRESIDYLLKSRDVNYRDELQRRLLRTEISGLKRLIRTIS
ncbi:MAG: hypothetical protein HWN66_01420 [Candidatus Helarchaeota archaeon]|nr:hypothetical protein [Candidatus Helarchaeota archaeon]